MPRTESAQAVFVSYASQDAQAARRLCEALRAAGAEVWLDQSELRGGDEWDRKIRKEIRDCALFIPLISANTHARIEGYFRLEWKLAIDRSYLMAPDRTFLLPVVIDGTPQADERVPERFRELQWTHLPGGAPPPAFIDRVRMLLAPEAASVQPMQSVELGARALRNDAVTRSWSAAARARKSVAYVAIGAVTVALLCYTALERLIGSQPGARLYGASIAVLPLANESGDASEQYFSDGISEDLITALSQVPGLKVIGRTSAFQFRDSKEDSRGIGTKLGVAHLLEGSVRRSGETVRVSAELIDTADGSTQWSQRYDRPYKDLFALQDEITRAVAGALRAKLLPSEQATAQSERPPSGSLEAYNAMLEGRFHASRHTEADFRKSIEYLTKATEIDPQYAFAWSALSQMWCNLGTQSDVGPAQEAYAKARVAAARALALAPNLAAAHFARGWLLQIADFDWHGAEAEFRRALELAPNDGVAKSKLADLLATFGQVDLAVELTRQALATEPLRAAWYSYLAGYLSGLNRLDEAERAIRSAIEIQPAAASYHQLLTIIEIQRGDSHAASSAAEQEPPGTWHDSAIALALQIGNDRRAAEAALQTLIRRDAGTSAYQIAQVYALRNDAKATFEWLDRAWNNRDTGIAYLLYDPFILRYRDDPRFAAFCRKVGLPVPPQAPERQARESTAAVVPSERMISKVLRRGPSTESAAA